MEYWYVNRIIMVSQSLGFKAISADSSGRPDQLIIHFSFNGWHNRFSPNANSAFKYRNRYCGFKSVNDALASTDRSDFNETDYNYMEKISRKMSIVYLLKNDVWVLKGGNALFEEFIGQYMVDEHNAHLFSHLLSVPIH